MHMERRSSDWIFGQTKWYFFPMSAGSESFHFAQNCYNGQRLCHQEHVCKMHSLGTRSSLWQALLCWHILENSSRQEIFSEERSRLLNRVGLMCCPQRCQTFVNITCNKLKFLALIDKEKEHLFISNRPPHKKYNSKQWRIESSSP